MMMMGGMGGSGGSSSSMGMMDMDMMDMSMMNMGNMGGSMNMGSSMGSSMNMGGSMGGYMGDMSGMYNYNMGGYYGPGPVPGGYDPYGGMANHGAHGAVDAGHGAAAGSNGLFGFGTLDFNSLLNGLLTLAIDIFALLLIVGLVVGTAVLIKRYIFDGEFFAVKTSAGCPKCGYAIKAEWACCPKCGEAKATAQTTVANPQTV